MSTFPDWLYRFTPRDEQVAPIELVSFVSDNGAMTGTSFYLESVPGIVNGKYTVPEGRILFVNTVQGFVGGGHGTGFTIYWNATDRYIYTPLYQQNSAVGGNSYNINNIDVSGTMTGSPHIVPSGAEISMRADFNNILGGSAFFTLNGVLIPRGNLVF